MRELALEATSRAIVLTEAGPSGNRIVFANAAFSRLTGYSTRECVGHDCRFLEGPDTNRKVSAEINRAITAGKSIRREVLHYRKSGESFWNDISLDPIRDPAGEVTGHIGVCVDVTAEHVAHQELRTERQRFEDVTNHIPGYVYQRVMKPDGTIEQPYVSSSLNQILELPEEMVITTEISTNHIHPDDRETVLGHLRRSASTLSAFHLEFRLISAGGAVRWVKSDSRPRRLPGGNIVWDGVALDITAAKMAEKEISFLGSHDSLTGLSNRERFKSALGEALQAAGEGGCAGLLSIDLHRLQDINDALGQAAGDEVLRLAGERLHTFAEGYGGTVARINTLWTKMRKLKDWRNKTCWV